MPSPRRSSTDTAAKAAARQVAAGTTVIVASGDVPDEPIDDVGVLPRQPYGRRTVTMGTIDTARRVPAVVASAARVPVGNRKAAQAMRVRRQGWQTEAWDDFDEVGEMGYTITLIGNLCSRLRLFPAVADDEGNPIAVTHDDASSLISSATADLAVATLARLRSMQGGQSAILREMAANLEVAGECYLHGHVEPDGNDDPGDAGYDLPDVGIVGITDDPDAAAETDPNTVEEWDVRSVDELIVQDGEFRLRRGPMQKVGEAIPPEDLIMRIWERHPRFSEMATCAMRRALGEAEAVLLLSREIRASAKSRLSNGILLVPSELSFGPTDPTTDTSEGNEQEDPFEGELTLTMVTPITDEGSASAVVPLVVRGPKEYLDGIRHIVLSRPFDAVLDDRIEKRILRIARALNMPTEVTTGYMATTFANAVQVTEAEFRDHIEPRAVMICDAITSAYFQWALESAGVDRDEARQIFVWFDPTALIRVEDQSEKAEKAHQDGVISAEARRKYSGFEETDAPGDDEILRQLVLGVTRPDPTTLATILNKAFPGLDLPVPAPPAGILGIAESVSAVPAPGATPEEPVDIGGAPLMPIAEPEPDPPPAPPGQPPAPAPPADPNAPPPPPPPAAKPVAASAIVDRWGRLGAELTDIDRALRARMTGALDESVRNAIDRAGLRIRTKVQRGKGGEPGPLGEIAAGLPNRDLASAFGPTVVANVGLTADALLAGSLAVEQIGGWLDAAHGKALATVERVTGVLPPTTVAEVMARWETNRGLALRYLTAGLASLTAARLFRPDGTPLEGEDDGTVLVPASLVRATLAQAGGTKPAGADITGPVTADAWVTVANTPVTDDDGGPLAGLATGPSIMSTVDGAGGQVSGWLWVYGAGMRSDFPPHKALDGTTAATMDGFGWGAGYKGFPETDFAFPGDHRGCFPAGTVVEGPSVTSATLRDWEGEVVRIRTASGEDLTATPNHPVLTPTGWVAAGLLNEGDEVVRCVDRDRVAALVPHGYQMPARIEDVAGAVGVAGEVVTRRVEVAAEDFHGDGIEGQVTVVRTDRRLVADVDAALAEPSGQGPFAVADPVVGVRLTGPGGAAHSVGTVRSAPFGVVGGDRTSGPTFGGPGGVHKLLGVGYPADGDTGPVEAGGDRPSGGAVPAGQGFDGLAGCVAAEKVVHVERHAFSGQVFNLDTRVGWYIAEGIVVHNCVCDLEPQIDPPGTSDNPDSSGDDPGAGYSTAAPGDLADQLGFLRSGGQVTGDDIANALANLGDIRSDIRGAAGSIAEEHEALLQAAGYGERGDLRYIFDPATRAKAGDVGTGVYDWFDELAPGEKARLRSWMTARTDPDGGASIDEIAGGLARYFGMPSDSPEDAVMRRWLQETRIIDAARALANGRSVKAARYGGLTADDLIDSPYTLARVFARKDIAAEEVARVDGAGMSQDAWQMLGGETRYGPAPWKMSESAYIAETWRLEEELSSVTTEEVDVWGEPVFPPAVQEKIDRLAELTPPGLDDPDAPLSFVDMYRVVLKVARDGGLI